MVVGDGLGDAGEVQFSVFSHPVVDIPSEDAKLFGSFLAFGQGK
jgi:hypothetical protein